MSITVFVALQSFSSLLDTASSVQKMHLGDYSITSENVGFSSAAVDELKTQQGISSVSTLKYNLYTQDRDVRNPVSLAFFVLFRIVSGTFLGHRRHTSS